MDPFRLKGVGGEGKERGIGGKDAGKGSFRVSGKMPIGRQVEGGNSM